MRVLNAWFILNEKDIDYDDTVYYLQRYITMLHLKPLQDQTPDFLNRKKALDHVAKGFIKLRK